MSADEFVTWLKSVRISAPFTLDDARALKTMIKESLGEAVVDVYTTRGDKVFVTVKRDGATITRAIDVE